MKTEYKTALGIAVTATVIYILLVMFSGLPLNDPDSYYYKSVAQGIEPSDGSLMSRLAMDGYIEAKITLMVISILGGLLLWFIFFQDHAIVGCITYTAFLFSPYMLIFSSPLTRFDGNVIQAIFSILWLFLIFFIDIDPRVANLEPKKVWGKVTMPLTLSIDWYWFYLIIALPLAYISWVAWKGSVIFIMYHTLFIMVYFLLKSVYKFEYKNVIYVILFGGIFLATMFYTTNSVPNTGLVSEMSSNGMLLFIPEYWLIALVLVYLMFKIKNFDGNIDYRKFMIYSLIIMASVWFMPRLVIFAPAMLLVLIGSMYIDKIMDKWMYAEILGVLFLFMMPYITSITTDNFIDIHNYELNCTNCTIVSDWSYGHVYRNVFKQPVMYKAHPWNITYELDYLYYKNRTCDNCIYLYHPKDYDRFDMYAKKLGLPLVNQTRRNAIYTETRI